MSEQLRARNLAASAGLDTMERHVRQYGQLRVQAQIAPTSVDIVGHQRPGLSRGVPLEACSNSLPWRKARGHRASSGGMTMGMGIGIGAWNREVFPRHWD